MSNKYEAEDLRQKVGKFHRDFFESQKYTIIQRTVIIGLLALILWRVW